MKLSDLQGKYQIVSPGGGATMNPQPTVPAAPDTSTAPQAATFPATSADGPGTIAAKVIGNIPGSAVNFGKSIVDFLSPLSNAEKFGNAAIGLAENQGAPATSVAQPGGTIVQQNVAPSVGDVLKEVPGQAYKMLVPQFLQHIVSGDLGKAAQTIENDPVGQIAPLILLARQGAEQAGKGAEFDSMVSKVAAPITKPAAAVGDAASSAAGGASRFLAGQLTGISPQTIEKIIADPAQFSKDAQSQITRPAVADDIAKAIAARQAELSGTGKEYGGIRTADTPVPVSPSYLDELLTQKAGVAIDNGTIKATGKSAVRSPGDISALQSKLYDVWQPEFQKGYLTPEEYLNFRDDMAKMAYNDSGIGKSTDLAHLAERLRGQTNADLRQHIPGLEELDKNFAPQQTELKALSQGLIGKDGNLSDSAINKIANATGKGKDPLLNRLETLSPGVTDRIKILKAVEDLQNSREVKTGTYLRAGALGAGIFTLNPFLLVSAIASIPEIAVPLLRGVGYSTGTINGVLKTLGVNSAISKLAPAAKSAVQAGGIGAPSAQNAEQAPTAQTP